VILVAAFSGLRQSELLGLRWSDVDFEQGLIHVRGQVTREGVWKATAKTSRGHRSVILADELVQPLAKKSLEDNASPDAFVFSRECGLPLRQREAVRVFMVATKNSYLTEVTWHHLRHTFASHLLDQGFDIIVCVEATRPFLSRRDLEGLRSLGQGRGEAREGARLVRWRRGGIHALFVCLRANSSQLVMRHQRTLADKSHEPHQRVVYI
jgi:hypothetical protein